MEGGGGWGCVDVILWTELCLCCICEFSLVCSDVEFLVFFCVVRYLRKPREEMFFLLFYFYFLEDKTSNEWNKRLDGFLALFSIETTDKSKWGRKVMKFCCSIHKG